MSYLDKLLNGVEVEWKTLGEVYKFQYGTGNTIPTSGGKYPVYGSNGVVGTHSEYNSEDSPVIGHIGAYAGIVNWGKGKHFVTYNGVICKLINDKVNSRYAYYQLLKQDFNSMAKNSSQPFVSYKELNQVQIPIPPLEIQQKIVGILDTFSELTAELTVELTARKKQYNYYREQLLSFEEGEVEWKTLGEVCLSISAGGDVPENSIKGQTAPSDEYPYPIYANATGEGGLYGFTDNYKIESDAVTISARGAKIGYHTVREGKFTPIIRLITLVSDKNIISTKFLNYTLYMTAIGGNDGGIPQLTVPDVKKLRIPIPSLEEQTRIVSILDQFDTLTNSISEGLPKEIALRKQQYEYYRDLLLTFPKP